MIEQKVRFWRSVLLALDVTLLGGLWIAAYWLRFEHLPNPHGWDTPPFEDYLRPLWLFLPLWFVLFSGLGLDQTRRRSSRLDELARLAKSAGLFTLLVVAASWLVFKLNFSRIFLATFWIAATGGLVLARVGFREGIRWLRRHGVTSRSTLIVGTGEVALGVHAKLRQHPELGLRLVGYVSPRVEELGQVIEGVQVVAPISGLKALVRRAGIDEIFIAQSPELAPHLDEMLSELAEELVDVNLVSDLYKHSLLGARVEDFEGMPLLSVTASPMIGWGWVAKRGFDLALSGIGLVVSAPLVALSALLVRLTTSGPAFYTQERLGLDGRRFTIFKIRTMIKEAEKDGPVWGIQNDPRVTRIGRFLRSLSIDELPQLWNVLRGEMSLVGPRPAQPVFVEEFRTSIPSYNLRHRVRPGLTGWAQIHGQRGDAPPDERLKYDLFYIRNWSIALDLRILWHTLLGGFLNRRAG